MIVIAWLAACAWQILQGAREVQRGIDAADQARGEISGSDVLAEKPLGPLSTANADFSAAESHLNWPLVMPLRIVPVLGRQLHSVQALSSAAAEVTGVGKQAVASAHVALEGPHPAGPQRIATLLRLSQIASSSYSSIRSLDLGPSEALVGPLARRRAQFVEDLDRARTGLYNASRVTSTVAHLLSGPTQYLLLAGNNAEMRSGSGMWLEAGVVSGQGGHISVGQLTPTGNIPVPPGAVPIGGDLQARWGFLLPSQEWRNLGLTPQFNVNAPVASQMWKAVTGQQVGGVVAVDIYALQQILSVTGPVTADGQTISAGNAVQFLTQGQYAGLSNSPSAESSSRPDDLGDLASATLQALDTRNIDLSALATALANSAEGRHIMAWSPQASDESTWEASGVAGELQPNSLMSSVINRGGNKLDPYLSVSDHLQLAPDGNATEVTLTVHLSNSAPSGPPSYVLGPFPGLNTSPGEYLGYMAFNVPAGGESPEVDGYKLLAAGGPEGPTTVLAVPFDLVPGASANFALHFRWPGAHGSFVIVPTARIPAVQWNAPQGSFDDSASRAVSW